MRGEVDGFRALAHVNGHHCQLVSRNGHVFKSWPYLAEEIAHTVRAHSAVLDGEIVCLDADGCSRFYDLMFRREWPYFLAFDVLSIDGEDLRALPLIQRKRRLARIMPRVESRLLLLDAIPAAASVSSSWPVSATSKASSPSGRREPISAMVAAHLVENQESALQPDGRAARAV